MAKAVLTATSDLGELVTDLLRVAEDFPEVVKLAADAQLSLFAGAIKMNWSSMVPWGHTGDYVYDSIGYNVAWGNNANDVVGMAGVFLIDSVGSKHGKGKGDIKAPNLAYWAEYGTVKNAPIPFMSNAYYGTLSHQDKIFADVLAESISIRLKK